MMSLVLLPNELLQAILKYSFQTLDLSHALRLRLVCRRFREEVPAAVIAIEMLQAHGYSRFMKDEPLLTEYTIHKTLTTRSSNEGLPSTINRVVNVLLQNTGQQDSEDLRLAYIGTLCKVAVAQLDPLQFRRALKPTFGCAYGGSDHVAVAAVCLNIGPVVDAYLSIHPASQPRSLYFGFALEAAASHDHLIMTEKLLSHSPNRTAVEEAIGCAARAGHDWLLRLLMSTHYSPWSADAIYGAAQGGHLVFSYHHERSPEQLFPLRRVALLTSLLKSMEKSGHRVFPALRHMLLLGAEKGHLGVVKLALQIGKVDPDGDVYTSDGLGILIHKAASHGHTEIVRCLLETGAELLYSQLKEPLARAARGGFITIAQMLLDAGANISNDWKAPFLAAASSGQAEMVRFLLDRGAKLEGELGLRMVTAAAERGWVSVVEMLCDEGIVVAGTKEKSKLLNPVLMAMVKGQNHVVELLLQKRAASIDPTSIDPLDFQI